MNKLYHVRCILLILLMTVFAVPTQAQVQVQENNDSWYKIHFGMGVGSKALNPDIFAKFLNSEITPRFPAGLTLTYAYGQWKSPQGLVREKVAVIDLFVESNKENLEKIEEVTEIYVKKFKNAKVSAFVITVDNIKTKLYYQ